MQGRKMLTNVTSDMLRVVVSALQTPVVVVLLFLMVVTVAMTGSFTIEFLTERRKLKEDIPKLIDKVNRDTLDEGVERIKKSAILTRQKNAIASLASEKDIGVDGREAYASQLLFEEGVYYKKYLRWPEIALRIGPMFGLLGTLIPLGPGLIALGQGKTDILSQSLLIAFDTTAAGVIVSAFAFVILHFRKSWYQEYAKGLESMMNVILDKMEQ